MRTMMKRGRKSSNIRKLKKRKNRWKRKVRRRWRRRKSLHFLLA